MTDQRSVDNSHLSLDQNLKGPLGNLAAALNSILGLGKGRRDLFGKTTMTDVLHLRRIASPPSNPSRGMIILPDGVNFDPLDDDGESICYWDNVNSVWAAFGSGGGGGGGGSIVGSFRANHSTASGFTAFTYTLTPFDTVDWDDLGQYDNSTYLYTAVADELVLFSAGVTLGKFGVIGGLSFYLNGAMHQEGVYCYNTTSINKWAQSTLLIQLTAGDTVSVYTWDDSATPQWIANNGTFFAGIRLS